MRTESLDLHARALAAPLGRRGFMAAAAGLIALPGCQTLGGLGGNGLVEAIRRILTLSSQRAFATLTAPGGFWDNSLARVNLPGVFGANGGLIQGVLTSGLFRETLQREFNRVAERGAVRAAPLVAQAISAISIPDALALVRGGPSVASDFLRQSMGSQLVEEMVPELGEALRLTREPLVGRAIAALTGVDVAGVARSLSGDVNHAIWGQIGREEAAIRANPRATGDALLIGVFAVA
jgi:hypothetical protein